MTNYTEQMQIERLLNQKENLERKPSTFMDFETVPICEVVTVNPNADIPEKLKEIQAYWKEEADFYGDKGSCVLGAGFKFNYEGQRYFMPPISMWQGSVSWEHCKDEIEQLLVTAGATSITYDWGNMD